MRYIEVSIDTPEQEIDVRCEQLAALGFRDDAGDPPRPGRVLFGQGDRGQRHLLRSGRKGVPSGPCGRVRVQGSSQFGRQVTTHTPAPRS